MVRAQLFFIAMLICFHLGACKSVSGNNDVPELQKHTAKDTVRIQMLIKLVEGNTVKLQGKIIYAREAVSLAESLKVTKWRHIAMNDLGLVYALSGRYDSALRVFYLFYNELVSTPVRKGDTLHVRKIITVLNRLGTTYQELGNSDKAIEFYKKSLHISDSINYKTGIAMLYNNIGKIYSDEGHWTNAAALFWKAATINKQLNNIGELITNYINIGACCYKDDKSEKCLDYFFQALELSHRLHDNFLLASCYQSLGAVYLEYEKDTLIAISYLNRALEIGQKDGFDKLLVTVYSNLTKAYTGKKDFANAEKFAQLNLNLSLKTQSLELIASAYLIRSKLNEKRNKTTDAFKDFKRYAFYNDSINYLRSKEQLSSSQFIYNAEKGLQTEQLYKKQLQINHQKNIILLGITLGSVILMILIIILIRKNKYVKDSAIQIQSQQKIIHQHEKDLLLQNELLLKDELEQKNRELTSRALTLAQENERTQEWLSQLQNLYKKINEKDTESGQILSDLMARLRKGSDEKGWEEFRLYFEQVHKSFYDNLNKKYLGLSSKEQKLCAFIRLGLSTKDIAAVTYREVRSVESARFRLRKKFELPDNINLSDFLSQF